MRGRLGEIEGVEDVRVFGDKLHLRVGSGKSRAVLKSIERAFPRRGEIQVQARPAAASLEDVFIALTGSGRLAE